MYLSGPMTGLPNYNAAEFDRFSKIYRAQGFKVLSPAEMDNGYYDGTYEYYLKRDIAALISGDAPIHRVYMMPNWHKSKGAQLEKHIAQTIGIEIWDAATGQPYKESTVQEAHRLVHGDRGVAYGHPFDDMGRTARMLNALLADKLAFKLTQRDVWQIMACVKLSRERNSPKRDNRVDLGGYAETGEMIEDMAKTRGIDLNVMVPIKKA